MADKHPYVTSNGPFIQVINHLRNSFPATVNADTLKKLGYAKKNESYVINTLRFIGIIDEAGNKTDKAPVRFFHRMTTIHSKKNSLELLKKHTQNSFYCIKTHGHWIWILLLLFLGRQISQVHL